MSPSNKTNTQNITSCDSREGKKAFRMWITPNGMAIETKKHNGSNQKLRTLGRGYHRSYIAINQGLNKV